MNKENNRTNKIVKDTRPPWGSPLGKKPSNSKSKVKKIDPRYRTKKILENLTQSKAVKKKRLSKELLKKESLKRESLKKEERTPLVKKEVMKVNNSTQVTEDELEPLTAGSLFGQLNFESESLLPPKPVEEVQTTQAEEEEEQGQPDAVESYQVLDGLSLVLSPNKFNDVIFKTSLLPLDKI